MAALFGNTAASRSQSKHLVEFRAGKMHMKGKMVHPDKRKGMVYVHQSDDSLMHFCWKDRTSGVVEDDLIIFPDDIEFKHVSQCTTGRVYVLKFRSSSRKFFFWLQEPKTEKDEENCKKVNDFLNNPPTPGSSRGGGGSGSGLPSDLSSLGESDLQQILGGMSQHQLMQLLGGMGMGGGSGGSGVLSSLMGRPSSAQSTVSEPPLRSTSSAGNRTTSGETTPSQPRPVTAAALPSQQGTAGDATATPAAPAASSGGGGSGGGGSGTAAGAGGAGAHIQLSDLQNILSTMTVPADAAQKEAVDLAKAISPEALIPILANAEVQERLIPFLPEGESLPKTEEELRSTVSSPQFQQALSSFSSALQSGQLGPLMAQFGLGEAVANAAAQGDMEAFVKAMQEATKKKEGGGEDPMEHWLGPPPVANTEHQLRSHILELHRAKPLAFSTIEYILGNDSSCFSQFKNKYVEEKKGKRNEFSSIEEFVELLQLFSNKDSVGDDVMQGEGIDKEAESICSEPSPPQAFYHKKKPKVIVSETSEDGTDEDSSLSTSDLCQPNFDFYDRCSCQEVNASAAENDEGGCLGRPDPDEEGLVSEDYLDIEANSRVAMEMSHRTNCDDALGHVGPGESECETSFVEAGPRVVKKRDDKLATNTSTEACRKRTPSADPFDTNEDARDARGKKEILEGIDHLRNDMRDILHLEGRTDSNEDLRGKPGSRDLAAFDHLSKVEAIEKVEEDDLPLGAESCPPIPLRRSAVPVYPMPSSASAQETNISIHVEHNEENHSDNIQVHVKMAAHGDKISSLRQELEECCPSTDQECKPIVELLDDPADDLDDSDSDIPSVIEIKPANKESSLEDLASVFGLPEPPSAQFYKPSAGRVARVGQLFSVDMADPVEKSDTNEDVRDIHEEKIENVDHLSGITGEKLIQNTVTDDNEDARSIASSLTGIDHLDGVGEVSRPIDLLVAGESPCVLEEDGIPVVEEVPERSPRSCVDENEASHPYHNVLAGIDHLEGPRSQILEEWRPPSRRVDTNEDDRSVVSTMTGVDHLEMDKEGEGDLGERTSTILHKTESFTALNVQVDDKCEGSNSSLNVAVKISQPDGPEGKGSSSSIIINSSSFIEEFAANVQAIYKSTPDHEVGNKTTIHVTTSDSHHNEDCKESRALSVDLLGSDDHRVVHVGQEGGQRCALESVSTTSTTQTDSVAGSCHEGPRPRRLNMTSASDPTPHTTLKSNIHLGLPSSLLEVDIAVQKTTYGRPSPEDRHELGSCVDQAAIQNAPDQPEESDSSEVHPSHSDSDIQSVNFGDMVDLLISGLDVVFWVCLACAVVLFEMCRIK